MASQGRVSGAPPLRGNAARRLSGKGWLVPREREGCARGQEGPGGKPARGAVPNYGRGNALEAENVVWSESDMKKR
jgi:hypothetical protein